VVALNATSEKIAIPVSDLFGRDTIYLGLRRFTHLRRLVREFIQVFAPHLDAASIARTVSGAGTER
jgi:hypothetical protein